MKIYLDNCCFNRPFDDQSQQRIRRETESKLQIQHNIRIGEYELVWSYILDYENERNPFLERRERIVGWKEYCQEDIVESKKVIELSKKLNKIGIKKLDSLHLACALCASCEYFITTDDGMLTKASSVENIRILDPIRFIKEVVQ